ncbi:hypothetical protein FB45DRAFT_1055754 [Roridomyces roridus]|uniref:Glutaminase A N-terminal domain-containing protein n=1 Tax=Roridomyces roridus TaxID=1738132 RepID=A0AAD7C0X0_9AGAR|nr:hypothetical protein FB45DRAFT_1055754 [Roridomyces roridus]
MRSPLICTALFALHTLATPSWTSTPFNPAAIPLTVRSPYLSTWLPQGEGVALNDAWPTHWAGKVAAWTGFVSVDGQQYKFLGGAGVGDVPFTTATQKSFNFTSTQSIFVLSAGPVDLTVTFLSPVETDLVKLSIPLAYMDVSFSSTDGKTHDVKVYSDITGEWLTGDDSWDLQWETTTKGIVSHEISFQYPAMWQEVNDHIAYASATLVLCASFNSISDGSLYYSTLPGKGVMYQTGPDVFVRGNFLSNSSLPNTKDTLFRATSDAWPVFALAKDFGKVKTGSVVFSIGHIRDPAVEYVLPNGKMQSRSLYFWSKFSTAAAVVSRALPRCIDAVPGKPIGQPPTPAHPVEGIRRIIQPQGLKYILLDERPKRGFGGEQERGEGRQDTVHHVRVLEHRAEGRGGLE